MVYSRQRYGLSHIEFIRDLSALGQPVMLGGGRNPAVLNRQNGSNKESPKHAGEGHGGEEDHLAAAAEIIRVTDRTVRRWREPIEENGYSGLADRRKGKPSAKRIPLVTAEQVFCL
jgi:hypothetical protein